MSDTKELPTLTDGTPHAWIGCLACYNAGRLIGEWYDAAECDEITPADIHGRPTDHEELWVFDHENFNGLLTGECSPMHAAELARKVAEVVDSRSWADEDETRSTWAAYVGNEGAEYATPEGFEDAYAGTFDSFEDYASDLADDVLGMSEWTETARTYFSLERWARDLILGGDYWTADAPGYMVHVFRSF